MANITIKVSDATEKWLQGLAEEAGVSLDKFFEKALLFYLARKDEEYRDIVCTVNVIPTNRLRQCLNHAESYVKYGSSFVAVKDGEGSVYLVEKKRYS